VGGASPALRGHVHPDLSSQGVGGHEWSRLADAD